MQTTCTEYMLVKVAALHKHATSRAAELCLVKEEHPLRTGHASSSKMHYAAAESGD
jgi:hypothetical protein